MLEVPVDAWYVWIGLALASAAALGAATAFPTAPPPDAAAAAASVDRVAAVDHEAVGRHPLSAEAVRIEPTRLSLRRGDRVAHARLAYGPVTPVGRDTDLSRVLRGAPPEHVFDSPAALRAAAGRARDRSARWQRADELLIRTVTWGEVRVTLVGA